MFCCPRISLLIHYSFGIPADGVFIIDWKWPAGKEWFIVLFMGLAALFGQYFVTKAYGSDKAGIVSVFGYSNIIYSVFIGMLLGDAFPDLMQLGRNFLHSLSAALSSPSLKEVSCPKIKKYLFKRIWSTDQSYRIFAIKDKR